MKVPNVFRSDSSRALAAVMKPQAAIEFDAMGRVLAANDAFLAVMGYQLGEVKGKHHSMFVDPAFAASGDYRNFWQQLALGHSQSAEFLRFTKAAD